MMSPLLRNVVIALGLLGGSYLGAGFVNAPQLTQPRLTSAYPRPAVIVVVPEEEAGRFDEPSTVPADAPTAPLAQLRAR
jgi:hypothetical protein